MPSLALGITGAAGFIGRAVVAQAALAGHRTLALARGATTWPAGVVGQRLTLPQDLAGWRPPFALDGVIHLACDSSVRQDFTTAIATHVHATRALLERCAGLGVRRLVYVSSVAVFGTVHARAGQPTVVSEAHARRPVSDYGLGKLLAEEMAAATAARLGIELVIARPGSVYGPGMHEDSILPRFLAQARAGGELAVFGDGTRTQDFVHVDDVATALLAGCTCPPPATFNLGSGEGTSLLALAEAIRHGTGSTATITLHRDRPDDGLSMVLDIAAARAAFGYAPRPLAVGLRTMVAARGSDARSPSGGA